LPRLQTYEQRIVAHQEVVEVHAEAVLLEYQLLFFAVEQLISEGTARRESPRTHTAKHCLRLVPAAEGPPQDHKEASGTVREQSDFNFLRL
jgi:hypothetical protein